MNYVNVPLEAFEYKCNNDIRPVTDKDYYAYYHDR